MLGTDNISLDLEKSRYLTVSHLPLLHDPATDKSQGAWMTQTTVSSRDHFRLCFLKRSPEHLLSLQRFFSSIRLEFCCMGTARNGDKTKHDLPGSVSGTWTCSLESPRIHPLTYTGLRRKKPLLLFIFSVPLTIQATTVIFTLRKMGLGHGIYSCDSHSHSGGHFCKEMYGLKVSQQTH